MIGNQEFPYLDMNRFMPDPTNVMGGFGSPASPTLGGAAPITGTNPALGLGKNLPTAQLALGGIATLGQLWGAFQANKLAKKQFQYAKGVTETNMANQVQSYNTALDDRIRSRAVAENQSPEQVAAYLEANKLKQRGV